MPTGRRAVGDLPPAKRGDPPALCGFLVRRPCHSAGNLLPYAVIRFTHERVNARKGLLDVGGYKGRFPLKPHTEDDPRMPENARHAHPPPFASLSHFPHRRRPLALRMHRRHPEYTDDLVIPLAKAAVAGSFCMRPWKAAFERNDVERNASESRSTNQ